MNEYPDTDDEPVTAPLPVPAPTPLPHATYQPFYKQVWFWGVVAAIVVILVVANTTG